MLATYLTHLACAAALFSTAHAQRSIPSDLSIGFSDDTTFQVSYVGDPENGFKDGKTFQKDEVAKEPEFAFGDSSGITPQTKYTILLIDVSCDDARTLHYAKTNFQYDFDITSISSNATAVQEYKAPGAFGETGDGRKYAFLFYNQPGNQDVAEMKTPAEGDVFDVQQFQDDNGLIDSISGIGMLVNLGGGDVSCDGKAVATGASSAAASSTAGAAASTADAPASSAGSKASSGKTPSTAVPTASAGPLVTSTPANESSRLVGASTKLVGPSPTTLATTGAESSPSGTATGAAATETGAASGLSLATAHGVVFGALIAFAGLLAF